VSLFLDSLEPECLTDGSFPELDFPELDISSTPEKQSETTLSTVDTSTDVSLKLDPTIFGQQFPDIDYLMTLDSQFLDSQFWDGSIDDLSPPPKQLASPPSTITDLHSQASTPPAPPAQKPRKSRKPVSEAAAATAAASGRVKASEGVSVFFVDNADKATAAQLRSVLVGREKRRKRKLAGVAGPKV
jgi:hypothetical protein